MYFTFTTALVAAWLRLATCADDPVPDATRSAQNWPQFRGPQASGVSQGFATRTEWDLDADQGIAWRVPIPGMAHSSPIIWGDRLFVTSAIAADEEPELKSLFGSPAYGAGESVQAEGEQAYTLFCLDQHTGEILWESTAHIGEPRAKRHPKATHANATPACDEQRVVACFGSEGLYCFDHAGELLWQQDLGVLNVGAPEYQDRQDYQWGFASSPILTDEFVVVQCDHQGDSYLAAFDKRDGREIWRTPREENSTWCTPAVYAGGPGPAQVIVNGYQHIGGYRLDTGEEVWTFKGGGDVPVPTPVISGDLVFLTSAHGRSNPLRAVRLDAVGALDPDPEVERSLAWSLPGRGVYMQTPLVHDGLLYTCSDGGVLSCYEAETGATLYRQRLGSGVTGFSGSPVIADGKLYLTGENGQVFVIRAGESFEELATNELGETCLATPAVSEGRLYFRTRHHLVAISAPDAR